MVCEEKHVSINFPFYGVTIYPIEGDIRWKTNKEGVSFFDFTEEVGDYLINNIPNNSVAYLKLNGNRVMRLLFKEDSVVFNSSIDDFTTAKIKFVNPSDIFKKVQVKSSDLNHKSINELLERIVNRVDSDIVTTYTIATSEIDVPSEFLEEREIILGNEMPPKDLNYTFFDDREGINNYTLKENILNFGNTLVKGVVGNPNHEERINTDQFENAYQLLEKLTFNIGASWWVDVGGNLVIGDPYSEANHNLTIDASKDVVVTQFSIEKISRTPTAVRVEAESSFPVGDGFPAYAMAKVRGEAGGYIEVKLPEERKVWQPEEFKKMSARILVREMMDNTSGSIKIATGVSNSKDAISYLTPGDYITIPDYVRERCDALSPTGTFRVNSLSHKFSDMVGWETSISLSRIPTPGSIETAFTVYDPEEDADYTEVLYDQIENSVSSEETSESVFYDSR